MKSRLSFILLIVFFSSRIKNFDKRIKQDRKKLIPELEKMCEMDQFYRKQLDSLMKMELSPVLRKKKYDSLWKLQEKVDAENVGRLIEITKKYGFPHPSRIEKPIPTWLIFHHAPKDFFEELAVLIEKENKAGRLFDNEYAMIKWHLNGREGIPFMPDVDVQDLREHP